MILVSSLLVGYSAFLLWLHHRVDKACKEQQNWALPDDLPTVSVVVAFRNEESQLPKLLKFLAEQQYATDRWEVILVDDHSTDGSLACAETFPLPVSSKVLQLPQGMEGKKDAIRMGVGQARGELLLFTDADCSIHKGWLGEMVLTQTHTQAELVAGSVFINRERALDWVESQELAFLVAMAASGIILGRPNFCNAANLLVKKSSWLEADEQRKDKHLASGDDVYLLHHLHKNKRKLAFCLHPFSGLFTPAQRSWQSFEQQRIRWAGKWKSGIPGSNGVLAVAAWLLYLLTGLFFVFAFAKGQVTLGLCLWALKSRCEEQFTSTFTPDPENKWRAPIQALLQPVIYLYVFYFGIRVLFASTYQWKGRNWKMVPKS